MKSLSLVAAVMSAALAGPVLAQDAPLHKQNGVLVTATGMTVYTFDKDKRRKSMCTDKCADNWPPVQASTAVLPLPFNTIKRADGTLQITYKGKPLYTFIKDKNPGDKTGDNLMQGAWHAVTD